MSPPAAFGSNKSQISASVVPLLMQGWPNPGLKARSMRPLEAQASDTQKRLASLAI
jgi:hypothetical protein